MRQCGKGISVFPANGMHTHFSWTLCANAFGQMSTKNKKLRKSQIAVIQLRRAIQLFNSKDYVSSITLAGAANEILGQLAIQNKGFNTLNGDKIKQVNNRTRNKLKHHDDCEDSLVEADFEFEAQEQIDSAIRNYWIAFDFPLKDRIVSRYVNWYWT